mmetsp:Transcript_35804/g.111767  ORF Transcript_35804/g.111767 Transcript_35804/m.111767 type:complete len:221 (+) Transcript_35804:382-1044(+)
MTRTERNQGRLSAVGVHLNLVHCGFDSCIRQHIMNESCPKVADSNVLHQTRIHTFLHSLPRLADGHRHVNLGPSVSREVHVLQPIGVIRRIKSTAVGIVGGVHKGNGPVHEPQVQVLQVEVLERLLQMRADVFLVMVRVVQFACDEEVFTLDFSLGKDLGERITDLVFVEVVGRTVNVCVASGNGSLDSTTHDAAFGLPGAKANRGHFLSGNNLDGLRHV